MASVPGSLLLLAGPNGAGKTSTVGELVHLPNKQDYVKLNADERTLAKLKASGFTGFKMPRSRFCKPSLSPPRKKFIKRRFPC